MGAKKAASKPESLPIPAVEERPEEPAKPVAPKTKSKKAVKPRIQAPEPRVRPANQQLRPGSAKILPPIERQAPVSMVKVPDFDLTIPQLKAIAALMEGATRKEAAQAAGVKPAKLSEWLRHDDTFITEFKSQAMSIRHTVGAQMMTYGSESISVGRKMLKSKNPLLKMQSAKTGINAVAGIIKGTMEAAEARHQPLFVLPAGVTVSLETNVPDVPRSSIIDVTPIESTEQDEEPV